MLPGKQNEHILSNNMVYLRLQTITTFIVLEMVTSY